MKRDNVNYLMVGSFVLLMGIVLFYGLYRITGHSAKGELFDTYFPNVAGVKHGTIVTFEGFEVGNVSLIEPVSRENRTFYRVTLNIRKAVSLPKDSWAMIATPGLLSAPLIEIKEGQSTELIASGGEIPSRPGSNVMESVANLADNLGRLTDTSIKPLLAQITQRVDTLGASLEEHLPGTLGDMRTTMARLNSTVVRVESLFSPENQKNLSAMLKNGNDASGTVLKLSQELQAVSVELDGLIKDARGITNSSGKELQLSLRRADALMYQLETAGRNLNEFSRTIRQNPGAIIQSSAPDEVSGEAK